MQKPGNTTPRYSDGNWRHGDRAATGRAPQRAMAALAALTASAALLLPASALLPSPEPVALNAHDFDVATAPTHQLQIFDDVQSMATAADLVKRPDVFHARETVGTPSFGETTSTIWGRLDVSNEGTTPLERHLHVAWPNFDRIDLWTFDEKGAIARHDYAGVELGFRVRPYANRFFVFPVTIPPGERRTLLIAARTSGTLTLPITIASPERLDEIDRQRDILQGIYVGAMAVMFFYNLFLFLIARDRSYFYYVLYVLGFFFVQLGYTGMGFHYVWPESPWLQLRYFPLFTGTTIIASITFTRYFLDARTRAPRADLLLRIAFWTGPLLVVLGTILPPHIANRVCSTVTPPAVATIILAAIIVARTGSRPARFFLLAFSMVVAAIIITLLRVWRILPVSFVTENGMQIGAMADVVLLSFALGDRISTMRLENERTERASRAQKQKLLIIGRELDIARRIQSAIIEKDLPSIPGLTIASRFVPMNHVGGDFYDLHQTGPGSACIVIADVSGHGVPAALIASMAQISFELQLPVATHPRSVIEGMSSILLGRTGDYFLSAGCAHVDAENMLLRVASAGHPSLLLCRADTARPREIRPPGRLIGPFENPLVEEMEIPLKEADRLIMFSDAILEARNAEGALFGMRRLKNFTQRHYPLGIDAFADALQQTILDWVRSSQLEDDFTLVVVDVKRDLGS